MLDDGCRTEGCNLTPLQKAIDAQKLAQLQKESDDRKCEKGNKAYCSGDPVEILAFTGAMLIGGAALETFILGGGASSLANVAYLAMRPALMPLYAWAARLFTRNPNAQTVSLGSFDPLKMNGYIEVAKAKGYTYFQMNQILYKGLNAIGLAKPINEGFMLNQINQSKDFFVTRLGPTFGSGTIMEMKMLAESEYVQMTPMVQGITNIFLHPAIQP
jgi:hypothetical protein